MPFLETAAVIAPMALSVAAEINRGINARKARKLSSPENQIKRMREAGLPTAAGSNINGGTYQATPVSESNYGGSQLNDNISKSITRQIDKKKIDIAAQELRAAKAAADIAEDNARNQTNPAGVFTGTNQSTGIGQGLNAQAEAIKTQQIVNQYMPQEKDLGLRSGSQAMKLTEQNIKNLATANKIQLEDLNIKKILSNYQERMSKGQLEALTKDNIHRGFRNTGAEYDNYIKRVAYTIELATMMSRIEMAKNAAQISGQSLEAAQLGNTLTKLSMPSTQSYYEIRRGMDEGTKAKPSLANTLLYLGMFQPNTSNYNIGQLGGLIPTVREGNTYNNSYYKAE